MKLAVCVLALAALTAACVGLKPAQRASVSSNAAVTVELLFEHEGVRVYRFFDGRYHYYAVPRQGAATVFSTWSESCGKGCTRTLTEEVPTVAMR